MSKLFSERQGIVKRMPLQVDSMTYRLRVRLLNCIKKHYFSEIEQWAPNKMKPVFYLSELDRTLHIREALGQFIYSIADKYFGEPINFELDWGTYWRLHLKKDIETYIEFTAKWYEVYDFLEFIVNHYPFPKTNREFVQCCNRVLEEENAGYRFINGMIVPIYEKTEISEIETAFENVKPWKGIYDDLFSALKHLSDREHPNYKDSVVASIRAVEGVAKLITHRHGTLGELMPKVQQILELNEHFAKAIGQLWRYANTVARHSDPEGEKMPEFEEAKFVLVTSCAIINYLITKANKKGIELMLE